ncbi:MAG: DUF523 domain-containing protein [Hadesarchaea archaeon]|nr:DUF523 domain-containing protein [Hadesarchaea archaeon]
MNCRYDGENNLSEELMSSDNDEILIPVCPEQLGGLSTPRKPMRVIGGGGSEVLDGEAKVINRDEEDVTENLVKGAQETLKIVKSLNIEEAILKARSPSCGFGEIHGDSPEKDNLIKGNGVTAALLKRNGIKIITEEDLG